MVIGNCSSHLSFSSYVFWMGDMNFRLAEGTFNADEIANNAIKGSLKNMLDADQVQNLT